MGCVYGFECEVQGILFFDVVWIIVLKKLVIFLFENVKNLKSYDKGKIFCVIMNMFDELGYFIVDVNVVGL